VRHFRPAILLAALAGSLVSAQQAFTLRFEVASIKLWHPPTTPVTAAAIPTTRLASGAFNRNRTTVAALITYAYDVQDFQLSGGEDWVRTEQYTVAARAGREVSLTELREMVKALLTDRFHLRVRTETREMSILELRLARSDGRVGPNLHDCASEKVPEKPFTAPTGGAVAVSDCASGLTYLGTLASRQLQATVVNNTGLTGQWWFNLYYGSEPPAIPGVDLSKETANPDLPSFTTALQEQLGLRLERTRGPVPVVMIDHIERPTEN
jgi:uncharacterized protein (TIGR03435 family)